MEEKNFETDASQLATLGRIAKQQKDVERNDIRLRRIEQLLHANYKYPLGRTMFVQTEDKTVANTGTPTSLFGAGYGSTTPENWMWQFSRNFRFAMFGIYSTDAVAPTLVLAIKFGSSTIVTHPPKTMPAGASGLGWQMMFDIPIRSLGANNASADVICTTHFFFSNNTGNLQEVLLYSASATTVSIDSDDAWDVTADWNNADPDNSITCQSAVITI